MIIEKNFTIEQESLLLEVLASQMPLSKMELKRAMDFGAVWVARGRQRKRVRRATFSLIPGDKIEVHYDPKLVGLLKDLPPAVHIQQFRGWGLWYKPAGLLSEGNEFGDGASILRQIEKVKGDAYLVHRLDREADGLMAIAYGPKPAAILSKMWQGRKVRKFYRALVQGRPPTGEEWSDIHLSLDGKEAHTRFRVIEERTGASVVEIEIMTGRLHQIRRHMQAIGHAVIGDPRYGKGNKDDSGLKLTAVALELKPPGEKETRRFELPGEYIHF